MELQEFAKLLDRPLICFDIESTGKDPRTAKIVELCVVKISPDGDVTTKTRRINPGEPIPAGATAVHGIADEDVEDEPSFSTIAKSLSEFIDGCDLMGYNIRKYDIPLLQAEFERCGMIWPDPNVRIFDAYRIYKIMESRTLSKAYEFYCGGTFENAHAASADVDATIKVALAQIEKYFSKDFDLDEITILGYDNPPMDLDGKVVMKDGIPCFNFGKFLGEPVMDHKGYAEWMLKQEFKSDTKRVLERILGINQP